jgi:hypothetical protein
MLTKIDDNFTGDASTLPEYDDLIKIEIPEGLLQYKEWEDKYGKFLEYRKIWVNEDKRRQGFGTKLEKKLFKIGKELKQDVYVRALTNGSDNFGKFVISLKYKKIYDVYDWTKKIEGSTSWLGDQIVFHNEIEQYRNKILGLTWKYGYKK